MSDAASNPANYWEDTIQAGATFTRVITIKNPDGTAMDLTGYTARGMLKKHYKDTSPALDLSLSSRLVITTPASGVLTLSISATDTGALAGDYFFDIEIQSAGGIVYRPVQGVFHVDPEVTK